MNASIAQALNEFAVSTPWLTKATIFAAEGLGIVLLVGLVIFLFSHEHPRQGFHNIIVVLGAALAAYLLAGLIKYLYLSPRPFLELEMITPLVEATYKNGSFPSGHAAFFMALAAALFFYHKRTAIIYATGALAIGIARVAAGVHWPTDVLAGWTLGILVATGVYAGYYALKNK